MYSSAAGLRMNSGLDSRSCSFDFGGLDLGALFLDRGCLVLDLGDVYELKCRTCAGVSNFSTLMFCSCAARGGGGHGRRRYWHLRLQWLSRMLDRFPSDPSETCATKTF